MIPLRSGTAEQFATIRGFLKSAGYDEPALCGRLGIAEISAFFSGERPVVSKETRDALDLLARVFFIGAYIPQQRASGLIPAATLAAMLDTGLLRGNGAYPPLLYSPVLLYPVYGVYVASDRYTHPSGEPLETGDDFVFPGISPHTGHFAAVLPNSPCERFLDIGAGTGMAALGAAARYARQAWALDISERATEYAAWNQALNGLPNVSVLQGDMFAPVAGQTFDRIVMHPPYDVSVSHRQLYCDGGEDGEKIVRRLFQEGPPHLSAGGRLYCMALIADLIDAPLEHRVRHWLGRAQHEFDVAVVARELVSPDEVALEKFLTSRGSHDELAASKTRFEQRQVEGLCYACVVVQRRAEQRETFTVRRERGTEWTSSGIEWLLSLQTAVTANRTRIRTLPMRLSPHLELIVRHEVSQGALSPAEFTLLVKDPLKAEMQVQRGIVQIIGKCAGIFTAAGLYRQMMDASLFPADAGEEAFVGIIADLLSAGVLQPAARQASGGNGAV